MAKKKLNKRQKANRESYIKQEKRIKQFIKRAEKRGYRFSYKLPDRPDKITKKEIKKLEKITPKKLYENATGLDPNTGKVVSGTQLRKIERSLASKLGHKRKKYKKRIKDATETIIGNFKFEIVKFPDKIANKLLIIVDNYIGKYGKESLAEALLYVPEIFTEFIHNLQYGSDSAYKYFSSSILKSLEYIGVEIAEEDKIFFEDFAEEDFVYYG